MKNLIPKFTLVMAFVFALNANAQAPKTIVETAAGIQDFSTLVAAVKAADLVDVLSSKGPFTVFAPQNAAFEKLPEGTVGALLKPENKKKLTAILTYHVVKGNLMAADVLEAVKKNDGKLPVKTVSGKTLTVMLKGGNVMLMDSQGNYAKVIKTDVKTSNGVIHVIDTVVMP
jgi:uncharacterized surface protein with fasciclin (FAS1) repeats